MDENLTKLVAILQEALVRLSGAKISIGRYQLDLPAAVAHPDFVLNMAAWDALQPFSDELNRFANKNPLVLGNPNLMACSPGSSSAFYPVGFAGPLLLRLLVSRDPVASGSWLQKVLQTKETTCKCISALWGVPVAGRIELGGDLALVPFDDVPDCTQKRWLEQARGSKGAIMAPSVWMPPTSALILEGLKVGSFMTAADQLPDKPSDAFERAHSVMPAATLALTLIGPRAPLQAAQWFLFDDPDLRDVHPGGHSQQLIEILPAHPTQYPVLDQAEACTVVPRFLALHGKLRDKVTLATRRISQALRRHEYGDKAVEWAIAMETLMGDGNTNEMTHKVKVRSVRILGGSTEERRKNAKTVSDAYTIRSKVVHTGKVDIGNDAETVDAAISICVRLAKEILAGGALPDWVDFDTAG